MTTQSEPLLPPLLKTVLDGLIALRVAADGEAERQSPGGEAAA
ncbi:hypothetical protein ACWHA3_02285 [Streptomyces cyaneofuscatus]